MDQLDITYQRAFTESPVQEGYFMPSKAREKYYDKLAKSLISLNVVNDVNINNDKLNQAITYLKAVSEAGYEDNINNMTQVDEYKSPGENKHSLKINDTEYHNLVEYEDEISDSSKQVVAIKEPITYTHVRNISVGIVSFKQAAVGVGIIGRGGRGITQGMIIGGNMHNQKQRCHGCLDRF